MKDRLTILLLLVLAIGGCGKGKNPSDESFKEKFLKIEIGKTTMADVKILLGKPNVKSKSTGLAGWKTRDRNGKFHLYVVHGRTFSTGGVKFFAVAAKAETSADGWEDDWEDRPQE